MKKDGKKFKKISREEIKTKIPATFSPHVVMDEPTEKSKGDQVVVEQTGIRFGGSSEVVSIEYNKDGTVTAILPDGKKLRLSEVDGKAIVSNGIDNQTLVPVTGVKIITMYEKIIRKVKNVIIRAALIILVPILIGIMIKIGSCIPTPKDYPDETEIVASDDPNPDLPTETPLPTGMPINEDPNVIIIDGIYIMVFNEICDQLDPGILIRFCQDNADGARYDEILMGQIVESYEKAITNTIVFPGAEFVQRCYDFKDRINQGNITYQDILDGIQLLKEYIEWCNKTIECIQNHIETNQQTVNAGIRGASYDAERLYLEAALGEWQNRLNSAVNLMASIQNIISAANQIQQGSSNVAVSYLSNGGVLIEYNGQAYIVDASIINSIVNSMQNTQGGGTI